MGPADRAVGAVLCGGASRRMGRDKALVQRDGRALAARVAEALGAGGCGPVVAVGGDAPALRAVGLEVVADGHPGEGPLGGLATALTVAPVGGTLVMAPCDLLDPDPAVVARLLTALAVADDDVDVAVPVVDGRAQWILSAWRVRPPVVTGVADLLTAGHRRLDAVAHHVGAVRLADVDPAALADADRPADLA